MTQQYTIGQLARAAGVPTTTLRYYERVGLVRPTSRAQNQYRLYSGHTLQIIRFIRAAQAAGLTLTDVRTLLAYAGNLALCKEVQPLIAKRLAEVSQRLEELRHIQACCNPSSRSVTPRIKTPCATSWIPSLALHHRVSAPPLDLTPEYKA
ncbi:MAG: MerR family transcriptional regulator [Candidatus Entotheonellia bacterium]